MRITIPLVIAALALLVYFVERWRLRQRARKSLEALAANLGIKRRKTGTDEELRARCRSIVLGVPMFTRDSLAIYVKDALWGHGYRRLDVAITEVSPGRLRVHAMAKVPAGVLRVIERELADRVPMTVTLELSADT